MAAFCKRHWRTVAIIILCVLVVALGVVVVLQAAMLRSSGWTTELGNVAEGVQAVATLAAFGALWIAVREWRSGQQDRRDKEADQARLMVVEQVVNEDDSLAEGDMQIRNRSWGQSST